MSAGAEGDALTAPSRVRDLLARHGLRPDKRLGQHFLIDANILAKILDAAELSAADAVLEIGPGLGTVTRELAARAGRVVAVEVDRRLEPVLRETLAGRVNVDLVFADALRADLSTLCPGGARSWKAVANLPYYITGPLLARLLEHGAPDGRPPGRFSHAVVMVQEEVARRFTARPGTKAYGAMSLLVQYHAEVEPVTRVSPTCFFPPPEVSSAVVRLRIRSAPPVEADPRVLFGVIRAAFAQRRKSLRNALTGGGGPARAEAILGAAGIDPARRGETLSLEEFSRIARLLEATGGASDFQANCGNPGC